MIMRSGASMNDLNKLTLDEVNLIIKVLNIEYDHDGPIEKLLDKFYTYRQHRIKSAELGGSDPSYIQNGGGGASPGVRLESCGEFQNTTIVKFGGSNESK